MLNLELGQPAAEEICKKCTQSNTTVNQSDVGFQGGNKLFRNTCDERFGRQDVIRTTGVINVGL